mmetsp:Transcript_56158/g.119554  ORF Transcript_56158/g.119554 Transcript_56158/m.119554 type:complete len:239 (-) Transcript_56158:275-991(-)
MDMDDSLDIEEEEDRWFKDFHSWIHWRRETRVVPILNWMVASMVVYGPSGGTVMFPGLLDLFLRQNFVGLAIDLGWALGTILSLGWATRAFQVVFTFEQKAMSFPPGSFLVFSKVWKPVQGSVIHFNGSDGRSYVRRVSAVRSEEDVIRTVGDLEGSPDDQPLYSQSGKATWLDVKNVQGTLTAGPVPFHVVLAICTCWILLAPSMVVAFFITSQPFLTLCLGVLGRIAYTLILMPVA